MKTNEGKLSAVDERTKILLESVKSLHAKFDTLCCGERTEQIKTLQRESKDMKDKNLDKRLWAIEKLFWPSVVAGVTSFIGFIFFIMKGAA